MMERLTEWKDDKKLLAKAKFIGDFGSQNILQMLAEYEDFEEIFREKMTDTACEFLRDKEEFGKWLDRNKWIANKCDEWVRAEEQGLLLRLPCKVGTKVYAFLPCDNHFTECQINKIEIKHTIYGKICYFIEPIAHRGCLYRYFEDDFGKAVFLTQAEAEQKLKEMKDK